MATRRGKIEKTGRGDRDGAQSTRGKEMAKMGEWDKPMRSQTDETQKLWEEGVR